MLKLSKQADKPEIFFTVQGEGASVGYPAVFVRAANCNLQCYWCDTDYTWNWQGTDFSHINDKRLGGIKYDREEQSVAVGIEDVAGMVLRYNCDRVVITGGEPLLQQAAWVELMTLLREQHADFYFEVETNGTLLPSPEFNQLIDQYNVSPKLSNSKMIQTTREKPEVLEKFAADPKACFKFVVADAMDCAEVMTLLKRYEIPKNKVMLMPMALDEDSLVSGSEWLVEQCKMMNLRYSDRLHIRLFDGERGT